MVADDVGSEKVFVDDDSGELKLREFKAAGVEPAYMDILRWRMDQKYGRRIPKKKQPNGLNVNTSGHHSNGGSPYGSPVEDRGRSPHRFSSRGPPHSSSPRGAVGTKSPLSQVSEETVRPIAEALEPSRLAQREETGDLVDAATPFVGADENTKMLDGGDLSEKRLLDVDGHDEENKKAAPAKGLGVNGLEEMKSVEI